MLVVYVSARSRADEEQQAAAPYVSIRVNRFWPRIAVKYQSQRGPRGAGRLRPAVVKRRRSTRDGTAVTVVASGSRLAIADSSGGVRVWESVEKMPGTDVDASVAFAEQCKTIVNACQ